MNLVSNRASLLAFAVVLPIAFALGGCVIPDADEQVASASAASTMQSAKNAGSTSGVSAALETVVGGGVCVTPEAVAAADAAAPNVDLFPSSCATKTATGGTLHENYDDCTGPFGAVHVTGGANAIFTKGSACDEVDAAVKDSGNLTANGAPLTYEANVKITVDDGKASLSWIGTWDAATSEGQATGRDQLQIAQDLTSFCVTGGGTGDATLNGFELSSNVEGFAVCPDACPTSGHLVVSAKDGAWSGSISVDFDGSTTAHAIGTRGQAFDVPLVCGQ
jgi:hypothetical protein